MCKVPFPSLRSDLCQFTRLPDTRGFRVPEHAFPKRCASFQCLVKRSSQVIRSHFSFQVSVRACASGCVWDSLRASVTGALRQGRPLGTEMAASLYLLFPNRCELAIHLWPASRREQRNAGWLALHAPVMCHSPDISQFLVLSLRNSPHTLSCKKTLGKDSHNAEQGGVSVEVFVLENPTLFFPNQHAIDTHSQYLLRPLLLDIQISRMLTVTTGLSCHWQQLSHNRFQATVFPPHPPPKAL